MNLQFISPRAAASSPTGHVLGGARLGDVAGSPAVSWPEQRLAAPLLGTPPSMAQEYWCHEGTITTGHTEGIVWRRGNGLLYGVLELDETDFADAVGVSPLQAASKAAYERMFRLLDAQQLPCLWRVWNYLADINGETHGLERYRQFNIGRQEAFVNHRRGTTGNVPAACAIGLAAGPLSIAFLAGAAPTVPIENPRQVSAYSYPASYGPRAPIFSRAALLPGPGQETLFISGTASILGHQTVHPGDVVGQCREAMANVAAVVQEANRTACAQAFALDELIYRAYVRHAADYSAIRDTLAPLVGGAEVVYVQGDICRADLLVEIEAFGSHGLRMG